MERHVKILCCQQTHDKQAKASMGSQMHDKGNLMIGTRVIFKVSKDYTYLNGQDEDEENLKIKLKAQDKNQCAF